MADERHGEFSPFFSGTLRRRRREMAATIAPHNAGYRDGRYGTAKYYVGGLRKAIAHVSRWGRAREYARDLR